MANVLIVRMVLDLLLAFIVAIGFAILFNAPRKTLLVAGLLGGIGHSIRFLLHEPLGGGIIFSTLCGAIIIGLLGMYLAHRIHTPPVIFTMPACITMIPGLYAYRTMMGAIKIAGDNAEARTAEVLSDTAHNLMLSSGMLFALAIGITISVLLFRKQSVKDIRVTPRNKH